jgi:hypothetical protein
MLVKVEAYHDGKFWCGRGIGADFFTQGKTLDELMKNVTEAASLHFEEALQRGETLDVLVMSHTEVRRGKAVAG